MVVTLVAMVTTPKITGPRRKMGKEGGGTHDNRGVKEESRRWRMLISATMMETNNNPPKNVRVVLTSTVVVVVANMGRSSFPQSRGGE